LQAVALRVGPAQGPSALVICGQIIGSAKVPAALAAT